MSLKSLWMVKFRLRVGLLEVYCVTFNELQIGCSLPNTNCLGSVG
uniref:Uncharacterized protein n=1 Tax=Rhizophora mucronata TaxID=61149 RepID=A0A2P2NI64_RHIMU